MATVAEILAGLDEIAPPARAAAWDPVGLQVGDPEADAGRIAVCHEVTPRVAETARTEGVGLIVSYHPLLFDATRRFVAGPSPSGVAHGLAAAGISVVTVHTAYDVVAGGAADALAEALGLSDPTPFGPLWPSESAKVITFVPADSVDAVADRMAAAGAGEIGDYSGCSFRIEGTGTFRPGAGASPAAGEMGRLNRQSEVRLEMVAPAGRIDVVVAALVSAHPYEEPAYDVYQRRGEAGYVGRVGGFAGSLSALESTVRDRLGGTVRVAGDRHSPVGRVAVVPGSGAGFIEECQGAGAAALVTGDVKHHDARRALRRGLVVVDPGHAATERPGVQRLYAAVSSRWEAVVDLTGVDPDPWTD